MLYYLWGLNRFFFFQELSDQGKSKKKKKRKKETETTIDETTGSRHGPAAHDVATMSTTQTAPPQEASPQSQG